MHWGLLSHLCSIILLSIGKRKRRHNPLGSCRNFRLKRGMLMKVCEIAVARVGIYARHKIPTASQHRSQISAEQNALGGHCVCRGGCGTGGCSQAACARACSGGKSTAFLCCCCGPTGARATYSAVGASTAAATMSWKPTCTSPGQHCRPLKVVTNPH